MVSEFIRSNFSASFFELPVKEPPESEKRKKFWRKLIQEVEPYKEDIENE